MNQIIHLLTNRSDGFYSPYVESGIYVPRTGTSSLWRAAESVRETLKLGTRDTDWYWKPLLASILADKMFCSWFDTRTSMPPWANAMESPVFINGRVSGVSNRPLLSWIPEELPDSFEFNLVYDGTLHATYQNGSRSGVVPCRVSQGRVLVPDLSEILPGTEFGVIPASGPATGTVFGWKITPARYPVSSVLSTLDESPALQLLLAAYRVQDLYSAIPDDLFRLGLIAAVLARTTQDHGI